MAFTWKQNRQQMDVAAQTRKRAGRSFFFDFKPYNAYSLQTTQFSKFNADPIVAVELDLPDGTYYLSGADLRFSNRYYRGKSISIGRVTRVIQRNLGIYEVSAVEILIDDTDRAYSAISEPIKGKVVRIKVGTRSMQYSEWQTILTGKIDDYQVDNFRMVIVVKDSLITLPEYPNTGFVDETNFANAYNAVRGLPLPVCYGSHSVTTSDDNRNRGAWPTLYVDNTSGSKKFLIACHAVKTINEVYVNKPSSGSTLLTLTTHYTVQKAGTLAGRTMSWIQFTDSQFTNNVVDTGGVVGDIRVNVDGKETNGDGNGTLISNPVDVLEDLLLNYLGNPGNDGPAFDAVRSICSDRGYNTRGGYVDKMTTANVLAGWAKSFNILMFISKDGKVSMNLFDPSSYPPGTSPVLFDEARDILSGSWRIDREAQVEGAEDAQIINTIEYSSGYHWAQNKYFNQGKSTDATSITNYGIKTLVAQMPWIADTVDSADVAYRILTQFKNPVAHASFKVGLKGILADISHQIIMSHANGANGVAWSSRRGQVLEMAFDPADFSTSFRVRDINALVQGAYFLDDESARVRVSNGTVAVTNGSADINATGATSFITAGVQVGDIIRIKSPTNGANLLNLKITAVTDLDTVQTAQTVWVNESSMVYEILPSWTTASADQQQYGHLCDETTGQFSNGNAGFKVL